MAEKDIYEIERRTIFDLLFRFVDWGMCSSISVEIYPREVESGVWIQAKITLRSGAVLTISGQRTSIFRERLIKKFDYIRGEGGNPNLPEFKNPPPPPPPPPIKPKSPINIL